MSAAQSELQDLWEKSPGYLYVIAVGQPPVAVKIGISTQRDMKRRLSTLQCGNLFDVLDNRKRPMVDAQSRENALHKKLADFRCHQDREWFWAKPELMATITDLHLTPPSERELPECVARTTPG